MKNKKKFRLGIKIIIAVSAMLLILNAAISIVLIRFSSSSLKKNINDRMLDISNTAASMLDGDVMERLTADDADERMYQDKAEYYRIHGDRRRSKSLWGAASKDDAENR